MTMMERLLSAKEESPPVPFFNFTPTHPSDRFLFVLISAAVGLTQHTSLVFLTGPSDSLSLLISYICL